MEAETGRTRSRIHGAPKPITSSSTQLPLCRNRQEPLATRYVDSLFGPDFRHVDLSVFKDFPVTERLRVQFRAESFNISNTPSFIVSPGSGTTQLGNTSFGVIQDFDTNYTPRLYQFALKVQF